jgi:hypothetical protein
MATTIKKTETNNEQNELLMLEARKVKALEKIANTMDALTVWFEEINKDEWSDRLQYYLAEWHNSTKKNETDIDANA